MERKFLSTKEVAQTLGVTMMSVNRWIHSGRLRAYKFSQNAYKISQEDLDRFIENSATISNNHKHEPKTELKFSIMGLVNNTGITDESIDEVVNEWNKLGSQ
jgi:excisionase family DNA binding protein